ncbi:hypothetical protein GCM10022223_32200 [Kineosporia mesophila]|uniref:TetR family transcriptional regulator n=1 Tax=Kineosporia mesophila TaxID=566012 RepID=A0ABP6ZMH0_9ACTN|nr:hypothetical protein [Kineosporia mesophila]
MAVASIVRAADHDMVHSIIADESRHEYLLGLILRGIRRIFDAE